MLGGGVRVRVRVWVRVEVGDRVRVRVMARATDRVTVMGGVRVLRLGLRVKGYD